MEIWKKLVEAQAAMPNPKLDAVNPRFGSKYATLASVEAVVRPAMAANGLGYRQTVTEGGWLVLVAYDGESEVELSRVPYEMGGNAQARGSELTYCRRYNLLSAFGLVGDEDDDGNAASDNKKQAARAPKPQRDYAPLTALKERFAAATGTTVEAAGKAIVAKYGNPSQMDDGAYGRFLTAIEAEVAMAERGDGR